MKDQETLSTEAEETFEEEKGGQFEYERQKFGNDDDNEEVLDELGRRLVSQMKMKTLAKKKS